MNPVIKEDIAEKIVTYGWFGTHIFPTEDQPFIPFNYTIGLTERELPEFITFGLPGQIGHLLLANLVEWTRKEERAPLDREVLDGIATEQVYMVALPETAMETHLLMARGYYPERTIRAMQLVWPDRRGRFPWHVDCDKDMARQQSEIVDFTKELVN